MVDVGLGRLLGEGVCPRTAIVAHGDARGVAVPREVGRGLGIEMPKRTCAGGHDAWIGCRRRGARAERSPGGENRRLRGSAEAVVRVHCGAPQPRSGTDEAP